MQPEYLTIEQAAEYLNVTVRAIRNWIAFSKIEYVKMGKYIRFRKSYLEKWVETKTIKAQKQAS